MINAQMAQSQIALEAIMSRRETNGKIVVEMQDMMMGGWPS
jgi:hypothetical protein